jgi:hypothetical protein
MSGGGPKVLAASTTATGVAILPDTGGSRLVFWIAIAILALGVSTMVFSGAMALKKKYATRKV